MWRGESRTPPSAAVGNAGNVSATEQVELKSVFFTLFCSVHVERWNPQQQHFLNLVHGRVHLALGLSSGRELRQRASLVHLLSVVRKTYSRLWCTECCCAQAHTRVSGDISQLVLIAFVRVDRISVSPRHQAPAQQLWWSAGG